MIFAQQASDTIGLIGLAGQLSAVITIVYFFLRYQEKRDEAQRSAIKDLLTQVEKMEVTAQTATAAAAVTFAAALKMVQDSASAVFIDSLGVSREGIKVMGALQASNSAMLVSLGRIESAVEATRSEVVRMKDGK